MTKAAKASAKIEFLKIVSLKNQLAEKPFFGIKPQKYMLKIKFV